MEDKEMQEVQTALRAIKAEAVKNAVDAALQSVRTEAVRNAVNAFNEGFMYGQRYAEELYNSKSK